MKIGIIGAGQIGGTLTRRLTALGHDVSVANSRGPGSLADLAKEKVMRLIDELGFDPVDAGGLDDSWRQQPGSPTYTKDLDLEKLRRALAQAQPERKAEWRAPESGPGQYAAPG